jgi:preprotein translocase subunit Sec61beta
MSKKNKVNIPGAGGGIFRVSTEDSKGFKFKPIHIIGFTAAVVVIEIILHLYSGALL